MKSFALDIAGIIRRLEALEQDKGATLRFANVVGIEKGQVRVQLVDGQNVVTAPLATLQRRVLKDQEIKLPDMGEPVAVLFSGKGFENGLVLGAYYSNNIPSPEVENHMEYSKFSDGTEIQYDRKKHLFTAKIEGDASITVKGKLTAKVDKDADVTVKGGLTASVTQNAVVSAKGTLTASGELGITLKSPVAINLDAPIIKIAGNLSQTPPSGGVASSELCGNLTVMGTIVADQDVVVGSVSVRNHVHGGVEAGPGVTTKPVGV